MMLRREDAKGALVGAGFGLSLGWLWFPWLGEIWLPGLVWGSATSGGAAVFLLLLVAGFPLGGFLAGRLSAPRESEPARLVFIRRHCRRFCHGSAYALLLLVLFLRWWGPAALPAGWPHLALQAAAAAYLLVGLYWGGRLIALPAAAAPSAFLGAVILAGLAGLTTAFLQPHARLMLWPQGIIAAWLAAEYLANLEIQPARSRGRPRKKEAEEGPPPPALDIGGGEGGPTPTWYWVGLAFAMASVNFSVGSAWAVRGSAQAAPAAGLAALCMAFGVVLPVLVMRRPYAALMRGVLAAGAVALFTLLAALVPATRLPRVSALFPGFAEGAITGLALVLLAGAALETGAAVRRAGMVAGVCVLVAAAGWEAGEAAAGGFLGACGRHFPPMARRRCVPAGAQGE